MMFYDFTRTIIRTFDDGQAKSKSNHMKKDK